jgi:hypothetical protein
MVALFLTQASVAFGAECSIAVVTKGTLGNSWKVIWEGSLEPFKFLYVKDKKVIEKCEANEGCHEAVYFMISTGFSDEYFFNVGSALNGENVAEISYQMEGPLNLMYWLRGIQFRCMALK